MPEGDIPAEEAPITCHDHFPGASIRLKCDNCAEKVNIIIQRMDRFAISHPLMPLSSIMHC